MAFLPRIPHRATNALFFANSLVFATWVENVPNFKALHHLTDGELSRATHDAAKSGAALPAT